MYKGWSELTVSAEFINEFMRTGRMELSDELITAGSLFPNHYVNLLDGQGKSVLGRVSVNGRRLQTLHLDKIFKYEPLNRELCFLWDALLDDSIRVVTVNGGAGTGKTFTSSLFGIYYTLEKSLFRKMILLKPFISVGRSMGFLPGSLEEKLDPSAQSFWDSIYKILNLETNIKKEEQVRRRVEIFPLEYARGRNLEDSYVIIDEAQNLDSHEILTIMSRMNDSCKVIVIGDSQQIDRKDVTASTAGLSLLAEAFKGQDFYAHITMNNDQCLRGRIAKAAINLLTKK